jgi:hypothetical protein
LRLIYFDGLNFKIADLINEFKINETTVYSKINKFKRQILINREECEFGKLGGVESIVEVDETHVVSRRDNRRRILRVKDIGLLVVLKDNQRKLGLKS